MTMPVTITVPVTPVYAVIIVDGRVVEVRQTTLEEVAAWMTGASIPPAPTGGEDERRADDASTG